MDFMVDDNLEDLRFKVGAAIEYDRPLDITIEGAGAQVYIQSAERPKSGDRAGSLVVKFVVPNPHRLEQLVIPDAPDASARAITYDQDSTAV